MLSGKVFLYWTLLCVAHGGIKEKALREIARQTIFIRAFFKALFDRGFIVLWSETWLPQ